MSDPLPPRSPGAIAAVAAAVSAVGACCGHARGVHAPDGCRICQLQGRPADRPVRTGGACTGWRPVDPWNDPPGNARLIGIEDSDALPCSTDGCGHRADHHQEQPVQATGLGACTVDGCDCFAWTYVIADDDGDVIDAVVLDPVGDAIRAVLEPYVGATWTADAVAAATIAVVSALEEHAGDVADYLRLDTAEAVSATELLRQVVMDYAPDGCHRGCACSAARARAFLAARGVQVR